MPLNAFDRLTTGRFQFVCFGGQYGRWMNGFASIAPAVQVEGVVKRFGATVALGGVALEIPGGTVFGLLGPNGAGKTISQS